MLNLKRSFHLTQDRLTTAERMMALVKMEGSPEGFYKVAYEDCITGGKNGGFILSGDCDLSPLTSHENIRQAVQAARDAEKVLYKK